MDRIEISVIIPVYRAEKHLRETLENIRNQTFSNFEVILVDDCGYDRSYEISKEFSSLDVRFRTIRNDRNIGAAASRNRGFEEAVGEYIIFLDADDTYDSQLLETLYLNVIRNNAEVALCRSDIVDVRDGSIPIFGQWRRLTRMIPENEVWVVDAPLTIDNMPLFIDLAAWNKLIKREFLRRNHIRFQELDSYNDLSFSMLSCLLAQRLVFVNRSLITYYKYNGNSISSQREHGNCGIVEAYNAVLERPEITGSAIKCELLNRAINNILGICFNGRRTRDGRIAILSALKELWNRFGCDSGMGELDPICDYCIRKIQNSVFELSDMDADEINKAVLLNISASVEIEGSISIVPNNMWHEHTGRSYALGQLTI